MEAIKWEQYIEFHILTEKVGKPVWPVAVVGAELKRRHNIDRRFISWGASGWHICFDVLELLLAVEPIGRIIGAEAMRFGGWQRLSTSPRIRAGFCRT